MSSTCTPKMQKVFWPIIIVLLFVISCDKDAFDHLDNASKFFKLGMYDQSVVELKTTNRFLKDEKYFQESMYRYLMWGIIALKSGDQAKAIENFKLALAKDPSEIQVRLILSTLYLQQQQYASALDLFQDKNNLDVTYGAVDYISGIRSYYNGDLNIAINYFEQALDTLNEEYISFVDNEAQQLVVDQMRLVLYSLLGEANLQLVQYTPSIKYFAKALEIDKQNNILDAKLKVAMLRYQLTQDPHNSGLYATLGYYYSLLQLNHKAIEYYQKALELSPKSAPAYLGLALAYKGNLNYPLTEKYLRKALENSKNGQMIAAVYLELGELFIEYDRLNDAVAVFSKATVLDPGSTAIQDNLKHSQLLVAFQKNSGSTQVNLKLGASYIERKNYAAALRHFNLAASGETNSEVLNGKGRVYFLQANYKYSIAQYQKSIALEPDNVQALFGLADNYMALDQYDQAINLVKKALAQEGSNVLLHNKLAYIYFYSGQSQNAVKEWQYVLEHINNDQMADVIQKIIEVIG